MKHYWVLGFFGVATFLYIEYANGDLWFQNDRPAVTKVAASVEQGDEVFHWTGRIGRGQVVEIKGVNGDIRAEPTDGALEVSAEKRSRRGDVRSVRIEMVEHADGLTFCAVYPSRGNRQNECAPGDRGRMNVRNSDVQVDFTVRVPEGVEIVTKTVNGSVKALELVGDVRAETVNGSIEILTQGIAEAETVNGSITASVGEVDWDGGFALQTVNGRITLNLPSDINADFQGGTVNGSITSDFPLTIQGRQGPRRITGVLGAGGPTIRLETVNGSIRLVEN